MLAFADDAVGLELVTEPFIQNLIATIKRHFEDNIQSTNASTSTDGIHVNHSVSSIEEKEKKERETNKKNNRNLVIKKISSKMNINRPVVSSCNSLSSSDKCHLSDICRQLIEPSAQLIHLQQEQFDLPKYPNILKDGLIYTQKNLENLLSSSSQLDRFSIKEFLQNKVANKSSLFIGRVKLNKCLSNENSTECCHKRKTVLECDVEYEFCSNNNHQKIPFTPGDSFGFYSANLLIDVYQVLLSVKVKSLENDDDDAIILWDYFKGNRKQVFVILNDNKTVVELLPYLTYGIDLRTVPKKSTLCHMAEFTSDQHQRRRLLELSSKQGTNEYQKLILGQNITICDILRLFDSCHPPINVFLAHLITAKPRYFSVSSLPKLITKEPSEQGDICKWKFQIIFSVSTNFSHTFMRTSENLLGLFSGKFFWHYNFMAKNFHVDLMCSNLWKTIELINDNVNNGNIFDNQDVSLSQSTSFSVYIFPRSNNTFKLTIEQYQSRPMIMIATGTGVAPFLSFLEILKQHEGTLVNNNYIGSCIFFLFGCRHPYQDFIYSDRFISYVKDQPPIIKHLCLCFSRCSKSDLNKFKNENKLDFCWDIDNETHQIKHVDQLIKIHGKELVDMIINKDALIAVCGNWKIISNNIIKAFCTILAQYHFGDEDSDYDLPEAMQYMKQMQKNGRFLQDIWT